MNEPKPDKIKRGYRACRKAKCDLGDIDAPSSPPCSRCKRESRECVFAPSRRGGNNRKRETKESSDERSLLYPISTSPGPTPSPKRRRLLNPPLHDADDPSSIVVAGLQNESDALQILALASGQAATKESIVGGRGRTNQETYMHEKGGKAATADSISDFKRFYERRMSEHVPVLEDFPLIKLGVLTADQAPLCPSAVIPHCKADLAVYASKERYTITTFIIIASRLDDTPGSKEIHDKAWTIMRVSLIHSYSANITQGWITDVQTLGSPPTIGLVESLLLLAENLPRTPPLLSPLDLNAAGAREEPHGDENRQGWQLIGLAVRSAYELGLDKMALRLLPDSERTLEIERARVAWTYRHVSLRLGKGFWARGAAVCFQGFSAASQSGPAAGFGNFPFLREIADDQDHPQEDFGSLIQAQLEMTQLMSNAHDTLYPNASRTRSLVIHGEYFKYLDEILWGKKRWKMFPLTDIMWTMFYYTQLYICAFSFVSDLESRPPLTSQQAHVERATLRAEEEHRRSQNTKLSLFPRGAAQSPDARYIFHMCDAAREILNICVNKLYPGGALPYLPTRYLLWFTYAAIVLLKALYSGAMLRGDHQNKTSTDIDYPAVRYGRQLQVLRMKLAGLSDSAPTTSTNANHGSEPSTHPAPPHHATASHDWTVPQPPINAVYSAPYTQQPMSDIGQPPGSYQGVEAGFGLTSTYNATDNLFGFIANLPSDNVAEPQEYMGGMDLGDFWVQVGPGEGGFPFR
ncbi:hypothetical protein I302_108363 [Kwoniella bestiolae CBS 10118]|uniref:Zn(2)-C6 fungal-type domain-containing protein n=1 Tax=Kwoniella bestiolae CBS 10118 TaxID=1296100 RepID=A0AAJ8MCE9_9TREE